MGWFWADSASAVPIIANAPHPLPSPDAKPPPSCPMHKSSSSDSPFRKPAPSTVPTKSCPYAPPTSPSAPTTASTSTPPTVSINEQPSKRTDRSLLSRINPLNLMPTIANERAPSQAYNLSLEREGSSIPRGPSSASLGGRGCPVKHSSPLPPSPSSPPAPAAQPSEGAYADDASDRWQYPSPQQMYNALLRKGYTDTDPTAIPAMVSVHNFLNEGAWAEILEWERRFHAGLLHGWTISSRGGEERNYFGAMIELEPDGWARALADTHAPSAAAASPHGLATPPSHAPHAPEPRLLRFEGRPDELTPRARWLQVVGQLPPWAADAATPPPFDRHDWYVLRHRPDGSATEVRYVIDYYSGPGEATGEPVFYLDVRPAIDGPAGLAERLLRWAGDAWWRASGGAARQSSELQRQISEARERAAR